MSENVVWLNVLKEIIENWNFIHVLLTSIYLALLTFSNPHKCSEIEQRDEISPNAKTIEVHGDHVPKKKKVCLHTACAVWSKCPEHSALHLDLKLQG